TDPATLHGALGDLFHGDRVTRGHVVNLVSRLRLGVRAQYRGHDVRDVHVGLALRAITQDAQLRRVVEQAARKVEADPVRLARSDHVAEAEGTARKAEHE